ncbi:MAG: AB hydrolase superfamily protein YdjP [Alphaproteobacteria bacterium MarineAlpha11_Bin1]|nr:MAG: AB hydrolase superfamily protein YdjP [Alphaproteobacteria bacterium MarineAlpha11_Bin1]|tara:strand:+ start:2684 stop:3523 length:840 start_codon:yes stop_codon:yes gene_type:complete
MTAKIETVVGRYIHVEIAGKLHRIYFEEAGSGIPLVCLHTAGSDSTQYRHLLDDSEILDKFRVIAFDMPWHGKSLPPAGYHEKEYRLTTELYTQTIRSFCLALELDQPVAMGCSMGGRIVLHLAEAYSSEFRAVIGVEASDYQEPWYDREWLHRPDVHGGEVCAALISGLVAPQSQDEYRWETLWGYLSSGPGVFKGDLHFYRADSDYRERVEQIDPTKCPVYLLTGEYDFSCTPEDTIRTAEKIGVEAIIMRELGHFPMSENPDQFRKYLLPILTEIA